MHRWGAGRQAECFGHSTSQPTRRALTKRSNKAGDKEPLQTKNVGELYNLCLRPLLSKNNAIGVIKLSRNALHPTTNSLLFDGIL